MCKTRNWFIRMVTAIESVHAKQLCEWKCDEVEQMCVQDTQLVHRMVTSIESVHAKQLCE